MSVDGRYSDYHEQLQDSIKKRYDYKLDTRSSGITSFAASQWNYTLL